MDVQDIRLDEPGRDAIHTTEIHPLDGQAFGQLHDARFGSIILARSQRRHIHQRSPWIARFPSCGPAHSDLITGRLWGRKNIQQPASAAH